MNTKKAVPKTATAACVCSNHDVRPAIGPHKVPKPHSPLTTNCHPPIIN